MGAGLYYDIVERLCLGYGVWSMGIGSSQGLDLIWIRVYNIWHHKSDGISTMNVEIHNTDLQG